MLVAASRGDICSAGAPRLTQLLVASRGDFCPVGAPRVTFCASGGAPGRRLPCRCSTGRTGPAVASGRFAPLEWGGSGSWGSC